MSDDSTLTDSSDDKGVPAKKAKIRSKEKAKAGVKKTRIVSEGSSEDVEDSAPQKGKGSKKSSNKESKKSSNISPESSEDNLEKDELLEKNAVKRERDHQGNEIIPIGGNRFISVDRFKGRILIGIREYYQKDGKWLPGKKGISLNQDQFNGLLKILPDVKKMISSA
ncbi:hypothetical protein niasHS_017439 [Heterodera schachtii]|uniref:Transcriptional coactivator p15 (PC4) C-terminal domain-containing protein n=1 Tax=Heterodera schachtii TaxID=97005 RepID=A0ABD2I5K1_HETSC